MKNNIQHSLTIILFTIAFTLGMCSNSFAQRKNLVVRIAKLQIDSANLENYKTALKEEIETSVKVEPGVLTLYAVYENGHPTQVTILEIYADSTAYNAHLQTPHFKKYKIYTNQMVLHLELLNTTPIVLASKQNL